MINKMYSISIIVTNAVDYEPPQLSWVPWVLAKIQSFLAVTLAYKQL